MPPGARTVALMLVLAGHAGLAVAAPPPARAAGPSAAAPGSTAGQSLVVQASQELSTAIGSDQGRVEAADYELPSPALEQRLPEDGRGARAPTAAQSDPPTDQPESTPLSRPGGPPPIPLRPHGRSQRTAEEAGADRPDGLPSLVAIGSSLAVVLGLFFVVAWVMRRAAPGGSAPLPKEAVEVLGRAPLSNREQMHLVRCGSKLLLVAVGPTGVETMTEITDPDEVNRLAGLCRQSHPGSATTAFRQVFQQLAKQRTGRGSADVDPDDFHLANAGIPGRQHGISEDDDG
jgi:flagellar biogenesis protein FliO